MKQIPFSPPDITEAEIEAVTQALRSGWITTGPQTKRFEQRIRDYTGAAGAACLNSATAALELTLRLLGVGPGDEVITSAYTYTASASVIAHVGAKIVFADVAPAVWKWTMISWTDISTNAPRRSYPSTWAAGCAIMTGFTTWCAARPPASVLQTICRRSMAGRWCWPMRRTASARRGGAAAAARRPILPASASTR